MNNKHELLIRIVLTAGFGGIVEVGTQPVLHEMAPILSIIAIAIIGNVWSYLPKKE